MKIICNYNNFKKNFSKEYEKLSKISKKAVTLHYKTMR